MPNLNFKGLADILLSRWSEFLPTWCPGGKLIGYEFVAGTIRGGPGDSFKCNIQTGKWADFASDEKGADLISLYATIQGVKNGEAAKRLADQINYNLSDAPYHQSLKKKENYQIEPPPLNAGEPKMIHPAYGQPTASWCYRTPGGGPIFYEARYETLDGKQIIPWSWCANNQRWVQKGFPAPRPLYGLDDLEKRPSSPVILVEGPKCAEAARLLAGSMYVPVTWNGGSNATTKTDWSPLKDRKVLIWPDSDEPGTKAASEITKIIGPICSEVKVLDVEGMPDKWDVADAVAEGWDWDRLKGWARPRAKLIEVKTTVIAQSNGSHPMTVAAQSNVQVNVTTGDEIADADRSIAALLEEYGIAVNKQGHPACNIDNVLRVLEQRRDIQGFAWFDTFHQKMFTSWRGSLREWSDHDTLELTKFFQREMGFVRLSDATAFQALTLYAHAHSKNEPRDWMESLQWDGQDRLDIFFTECLGAADASYIRAASRNFWIGMVARVFNPGCKMDNMVVLEGPQGALKSTALRKIGGIWFTETNESVANKDFFLILQGNLLIEIAELHTFSKAEVTRIKQVITCQTDRFRAPYERLVSNHPRQSIFVGSTNEDAYLKDTTGNRRFWPVKCGKILPDLIGEFRDQLFAEAVSKFKAGATWWEMPKNETELEQEERRQGDEWETLVYDYLLDKTDVTVGQIAIECLKCDLIRLDKNIQLRITAILKRLGWERVREWGSGQRRAWRKPGSELGLNENV